MVKDVYSEKEVAFAPVFNVKASNTVSLFGMYSKWMLTIFMSLILKKDDGTCCFRLVRTSILTQYLVSRIR